MFAMSTHTGEGEEVSTAMCGPCGSQLVNGFGLEHAGGSWGL